ncbi:YdcF family protein [Aureimonas sp. D3]|uniref:YdcF family protein n=1 Tax=Aureimonas sp. D3 TaxID=1638164 RepID=UPI0007825FEB|nr:YdcF family protein [Aureimonas sp. D3]
MFFAVSKLGWYLVQPLVAILLAFGVGFLCLALKLPRTGITLLAIGCASLTIFSLSPLGLLMLAPLENRFPKPVLPERVTGIVVLGGSFDTLVARTRGEPELNDAADRITTTLALSRLYPDAKVIFSGGAAAMFEEDVTESSVAQKLFDQLGLAPERLILEDRSRNTIENARFSKELASPQRGETWLLVTSAAHMPRSVGCFRTAGFDIIPYPTDYQTPGGDMKYRPSTATVRNLEKVHFAIREYLGLFAYYLTGKTDAWIPAPHAPSGKANL